MLIILQESDLTFRLAGGLVIWQPMWEHRQPDVPAFSALVKPMRNIVTGQISVNSPIFYGSFITSVLNDLIFAVFYQR